MPDDFGGLDAREGLTVYTDGSCSHIDRCGGWAWVAFDLYERMVRGGGPAWDTTISVMELRAPTEALEWIYAARGPCVILVISDSEYVVKGITDRTRKRRANQTEWYCLEEAIAKHTMVEFMHTKGHADDLGNIEADKLAGEFRQAAKQEASLVS
jgi:ribonuclease HI